MAVQGSLQPRNFRTGWIVRDNELPVVLYCVFGNLTTGLRVHPDVGRRDSRVGDPFPPVIKVHEESSRPRLSQGNFKDESRTRGFPYRVFLSGRGRRNIGVPRTTVFYLTAFTSPTPPSQPRSQTPVGVVSPRTRRVRDLS